MPATLIPVKTRALILRKKRGCDVQSFFFRLTRTGIRIPEQGCVPAMAVAIQLPIPPFSGSTIRCTRGDVRIS